MRGVESNFVLSGDKARDFCRELRRLAESDGKRYSPSKLLSDFATSRTVSAAQRDSNNTFQCTYVLPNEFPESTSDTSLVAPFQADIACITCSSIIHNVSLVQSINSPFHGTSTCILQNVIHKPLVCGSALSVYISLQSKSCLLSRPYNMATQILLQKSIEVSEQKTKNFRYFTIIFCTSNNTKIDYLLLSTVHKNVLNNK